MAFVSATEYVRNNVDAASMQNTNSSLDKEAFLKLLITQMQYQDPLNPMDDKEFIAQMAQFSSLEQMQNMSATMNQVQAYNLIGKEIVASQLNASTGQYDTVYGIVESVTSAYGKISLNLTDGTSVELDNVVHVYADYMQEIINNNTVVGQAMNMIGKTVQAVYVNDDGETIFVEGVVDYVRTNGNLIIGDLQVPVSAVYSVADGKMIIGKNIYIQNSTTTDTIEGIKFINEKRYLVAGGENYLLEAGIDELVSALNYISKKITKGGVTYEIEAVKLKDGELYLLTKDNQELDFTEFIK